MRFVAPVLFITATAAVPVVHFGGASCDCCGDQCGVLATWQNAIECQKAVPSSCSIQVIWSLETSNCTVPEGVLFGTGGALTYEDYKLGVSELDVHWTGFQSTPVAECTKMGFGPTTGAVFDSTTCAYGTQLPAVTDGVQYDFKIPVTEAEGIMIVVEDATGGKCQVDIPSVQINATEAFAGTSGTSSAPAFFSGFLALAATYALF
eukprot:Gregarina_sp_Poly_1__5969@NODE_3142_length_1340_cov_1788_003928_g1997_i0_p1_GENE_NODE_3142_length_1340_cov_1788_003928_g1997_i0NODE_3142_length_1340_cov_1788_003928_g1997_i0_p1_ORF_typecomplete_len206_score24_32_NODE_3142_length_1340_cov_1788_003928_g1997_i05861203